MQMSKGIIATIYAILAAIFYAINIPFAKTLLQNVEPTIMAALLYLGAGSGIALIYLFSLTRNTGKRSTPSLNKDDLPYVSGMIILDILAPIALMLGLAHTAAANASLLNNFEIVATSLIALCIFKESISARLWHAIVLVTLSSILLSFEDISSLNFSWGSLLVLLAAVFWGFENNCTKMLASKNTYEIVILKGLGSGLGALLISLIIGETLPPAQYIPLSLLLGFIAYGLSIFCYIKAQNVLGAAKTSAYYAITPFIGAFFSFILLHETPAPNYLPALLLMLAGTILIILDTLSITHNHTHIHKLTKTMNGITYNQTIRHKHTHSHSLFGHKHNHQHTMAALPK